MRKERGFGHGKVLLFGEHAVVYGQPALAAALEVGVEACVERVGCDATRLEGEDGDVIARVGGRERLALALERVTQAVRTACGEVPNCVLRVRSALPLGAGLGSSAALSVAVARALIAVAPKPIEDPLTTVLHAADSAERVFHGNPSGVDHTVSALGGVLMYTRSAPEPFRAIQNVPAVRLIVAQMESGADTGEMVSGVRTRRESYPEAMDALFAWMGHLSHQAEHALHQPEPGQALGGLMNLAHGALVSIGVSTPALDCGCHAARSAGAWGAKLTGAGGGGCLIATAPDHAIDDVHDALLDAGALRVFVSQLTHNRDSTSKTSA